MLGITSIGTVIPEFCSINWSCFESEARLNSNVPLSILPNSLPLFKVATGPAFDYLPFAPFEESHCETFPDVAPISEDMAFSCRSLSL